ncbi:MAG: hypothetical protein AB7H97_09065 [Pseudobdellovibrionaceae bacterium]
MKSMVLFLFLNLGVALSIEAKGPIPSESGNHCLDQAVQAIKQKFGKQTRILMTHNDSGLESQYLWIRTNLCEGYFVGVYDRNASCTSAHYGFVPSYIKRIWAYGKCRKLLPKDLYP